MPAILSTPLSLYSIPLVWATAFYPTILKSSLIIKTIGFNNVNPRGNVARLANHKNIPADIAARVARMEAAHTNGNEVFPLWAAAVIVGNYAGLDHQTMNIASLAYVVLRIVYNYVYINQRTQAQSIRRTATFFTAISLPLFLLIKAANEVRAK